MTKFLLDLMTVGIVLAILAAIYLLAVASPDTLCAVNFHC